MVVETILGIATIYSASESGLGKLYKKYKSQIKQIKKQILKEVQQEKEDYIRIFFDDILVLNALEEYKTDGTYDEDFLFDRFKIACNNLMTRLEFNTLWGIIKQKIYINISEELKSFIISEKVDLILYYSKKTHEDVQKIKKKLIPEKKSGFEGFTEAIDEQIQKIAALTETYVKPKEYDDIVQALKERHVAIITGSPEYGKTFTAYHILLEYYTNNFTAYHIKIRDFQKNISKELKSINQRLYNNEKIAVYLDDPFGQTEYNNLDKSSIDEISDLIANFNKNQNDSILIITSRKHIFDKVQDEVLTGYDSDKTVVILDLKNKSYDDNARETFLEKCAKFHKVSWYHNIELLDFVKSKLNDYLPTMLNIWNFTKSYLAEPNQDKIFESIKRYSVSTPTWFATQILDDRPEVMYFLSFPFIYKWKESFLFKKYYRELIKGLDNESFYKFDKMCLKFKDQINAGELMTFSHPSYLESLDYLLCPEKIRKRYEKIEDSKFKEIFIETLSKLSENKYLVREIAYGVLDNCNRLPKEAQNMLFELAKKEGGDEVIAHHGIKNFNNLPKNVQNILFELAKEEGSVRWLATSIIKNFNNLPKNVQNILFELVKKEETSEDVAEAIAHNFDNLPKETSVRILFELAKKEGSVRWLVIAVISNFHIIPKEAQNILFELAKKEEAVEDVVEIIASDFSRLPKEAQNILFELAKKEETVRYVTNVINLPYVTIPESDKKKIFEISGKINDNKALDNL